MVGENQLSSSPRVSRGSTGNINKLKPILPRWNPLDAKNLLIVFQAEDHPQFQAYKQSRSIATRYHASWIPLGLNENDLKSFQRAFGSSPLNDRMRLIRNQMLLTEVNMQLNSHLSDYEKRVATNLMRRRNKIDLGIARVEMKRNYKKEACCKCEKELQSEKFYLTVLDRHAKDRMWCLRCFRCSECNELLADFIYFWHAGSPLCLRHYGEKFRPRCQACDELIFAEEYTRANNKTYHVHHFVCRRCHTPLTESTYAVYGDEPYCLECYDEKFAYTCFKCEGKIMCKETGLTFQNQTWHAKCFKCFKCDASLSECTFMLHEGEIFCMVCYNSDIAARCFSCNKVLVPGSRTLNFRDKKWHEDCFKCIICNKSIGVEEFIPTEKDMPICLQCHASTMRPQCVKCKKPITNNGLMYKGQSWHSQCFTCGYCKEEIGYKKFTYRDGIPYCAACYANHLAKRCAHCGDAISGFKGDQYVTVEGQDYHSSCFKCNLCSTSLVLTGFIRKSGSYVCPTCARIGPKNVAGATRTSTNSGEKLQNKINFAAATKKR